VHDVSIVIVHEFEPEHACNEMNCKVLGPSTQTFFVFLLYTLLLNTQIVNCCYIYNLTIIYNDMSSTLLLILLLCNNPLVYYSNYNNIFIITTR